MEKSNTYERLTFNLMPSPARLDRMEGIEYTVVPMAMLTEGVHNGSNGPLLYTKDELKKIPSIWNGRPIVVYHPTLNGQAISAGDPIVFDRQKVGFVMNTRWDGKLRSEAWIDPKKANAIDPRIMDHIKNNRPMEVSTGVFTDQVGEPGTWNEEEYVAHAINYRPDHLALLPDKVGACSLEDGAGLLVANALKQDDERHSLVRNALDEEVVAVFDDFVILSRDGNLQRRGYVVNEGVVQLMDETQDVVSVVEYRTLDGTYVGNSSPREFQGNISQQEENDMSENVTKEKEELVEALIANEFTTLEEGDRETLLGLSDDVLKRMVPVVPEPPQAPSTNESKEEETPETVQKSEKQRLPITMNEFLETAPEELKGPLAQMISNHNDQRREMIEGLVKNDRNTFTQEELERMPFDSLKKLEKLARVEQPQGDRRALYVGASTMTGNSTPPVEEPLVMPSISFSND